MLNVMRHLTQNKRFAYDGWDLGVGREGNTEYKTYQTAKKLHNPEVILQFRISKKISQNVALYRK